MTGPTTQRLDTPASEYIPLKTASKIFGDCDWVQLDVCRVTSKQAHGSGQLTIGCTVDVVGSVGRGHACTGRRRRGQAAADQNPKFYGAASSNTCDKHIQICYMVGFWTGPFCTESRPDPWP